jgi:hypothetical protein
MMLVDHCYEFSRPILDEWPEQNVLTARSLQGQFLYVQAYSACRINNDYWSLRTSGLTDSCKIVARHLFELFLNSRVGVQSPENALGCIQYELEQRLKKCQEPVLEGHEGFKDLKKQTADDLEVIKNLSGGCVKAWNWWERANHSQFQPAYLLYRHFCEYTHAGYVPWRPEERKVKDPLTDRAALWSLVDTAFQLHCWSHNPADAKICSRHSELMKEIESFEYHAD